MVQTNLKEDWKSALTMYGALYAVRALQQMMQKLFVTSWNFLSMVYSAKLFGLSTLLLVLALIANMNWDMSNHSQVLLLSGFI